jgi:hypothetical protein
MIQIKKASKFVLGSWVWDFLPALADDVRAVRYLPS